VNKFSVGDSFSQSPIRQTDTKYFSGPGFNSAPEKNPFLDRKYEGGTGQE